MDLRADLRAPCPPGELFAWVRDLDRYPAWLEIVPSAVPADPAPGDPGPAWHVELRARVGPLARSKRLRMTRSALAEDPGGDRSVTFERAEVDGREHATWRLRAAVAGEGADRSVLTMDLHYGGSLWVPMLDRVLRAEIERSRQRLHDLVA